MKKPYVLLIPCLLFTGCATNDHLTLKKMRGPLNTVKRFPQIRPII